MWTIQYSVETRASSAAIWALFSDVSNWKTWNTGIERIEVCGPFAVGTRFVMTPPRQDPIEMRLIEVRPLESFTDEASLGDVIVRVEHRIEELDASRRRIVYVLRILGPSAERVGPEIGPQIASDFPEVLAALVRKAEGA